MSENTKIEWCDHTFNPAIGCKAISPGCAHCYAAALAKRTGRDFATPTRTKDWSGPVKWNKQAFFECPDCGARGTAKAMGDEPKACKHLNARPARARVFCASMADVFDNQWDPQWRADLFELIEDTPNLDWLLLTKRIGNVQTMLTDTLLRMRDLPTRRGQQWPWPNVWLGATVVNQEEADRDIPKLLAVPARVRFLSMEPLLGPVQVSRLATDTGPQLDWVIVGGESGHGARPAQLLWFRSIVNQCRAAGAPVMVKQLGGVVLDDGMSSPGEHWPASAVRNHHPRLTDIDPGFSVRLNDRKGGDIGEWPEDLRVREFPQ